MAEAMHCAFNRSKFSRFINSGAGRVFRLAGGAGFLALGLYLRGTAPGLAALCWCVFPLTAGGFDLCYFSAAMGGPIQGRAIRDFQRSS
ncbi:MAG: hypothetical protein JST92_06235 [Deltaproteobacteria bacterium]|nr:hypothetical protein [Deltaproteobacteria bacterium]